MKRIYKYSLNMGHPTTIELPTSEYTILHTSFQKDIPYVWILFDDTNTNCFSEIKLDIVGTGWGIKYDDFKHIGTIMTSDELYIWHILQIL